MKYQKEIYSYFEKYNLSNNEKNELFNIIYPIFMHPEFQKRMESEFMHHGTVTLGEHILKDTVLTYMLCKKYMVKKKRKINIIAAIKISMLHDLYTYPWQNSKRHTKFSHKHGFRHPIEAAINAAYWFPEYFKNKHDAEIIIDGIIHHMFPLPVTYVKNNEIGEMELNNYEMYKTLPNDIKNIILKSIKRKHLGVFSFTRSLYNEGRIMSKADKKVAISEIKNFSSAKALLTGKNKKIKNGE